MRHALPWKKRGGGTKWGALKKNRSQVHTLSLPPPKTEGGKRKREREESNREKENTHTHTHTLAHTSVPVKPE